MANDPVTGVLTAVATAVALSYLAKLALKAKPASVADGRLILTYPFFLRVPGAIMSAGLAAFGASIPAWAGAEPRSTVDIAIIWVVAVFIGGLGVYGALEFPFVRIEVREDGLSGRSPWRSERFISWQSIESVRFSSGAQWLVVRATDGQVIRAHLYLAGVCQLYEALKSHVPPQAWKNLYQPFEDP